MNIIEIFNSRSLKVSKSLFQKSKIILTKIFANFKYHIINFRHFNGGNPAFGMTSPKVSRNNMRQENDQTINFSQLSPDSGDVEKTRARPSAKSTFAIKAIYV